MVSTHELHYTASGISLCGVKDVMEFSDREIILSLENIALKITGSDLKIKEVDLEKGVLKANGDIITVTYGGVAKESFLKKIFK